MITHQVSRHDTAGCRPAIEQHPDAPVPHPRSRSHRMGSGVRDRGRLGDDRPHSRGVFGLWAALAGAAQLVVALRRSRAARAAVADAARGWGVRPLGIAFITAAVVGYVMLIMLVVYTATGGLDFIIEAWLLVRRRRLATAASPLRSAR